MNNNQNPFKLCEWCEGSGVDREGIAVGNPYPCVDCEGTGYEGKHAAKEAYNNKMNEEWKELEERYPYLKGEIEMNRVLLFTNVEKMGYKSDLTTDSGELTADVKQSIEETYEMNKNDLHHRSYYASEAMNGDELFIEIVSTDKSSVLNVERLLEQANIKTRDDLDKWLEEEKFTLLETDDSIGMLDEYLIEVDKQYVILHENMWDEHEREVFQAEIPYLIENHSIRNEDDLVVPLKDIWVEYHIENHSEVVKRTID